MLDFFLFLFFISQFPNMSSQEALDSIRKAANNAAKHAKNWIAAKDGKK